MRAPTQLAALALLSLAFSNGLAQPTSSTPVACMTYPVVSGARISFGVPLFELPTLAGFASSVTSNTIGVTNVSWAANQFAAAGSPYFVVIKSGSQVGRTLLVTANTANTLTLDVEDTPLDTNGFAVTGGIDTIELVRGDTLGSLFGSAADGSGLLSSGIKGGTSTQNADNVQLFTGGTTLTYFFNTSVGTWVQSGTTTNRNGLILYPDDGMLILRRGPTGNVTMLGRVPATRLLTKLPGGTTNTISVRFPADTTLGSLNFGAPGTWINGANSTVADTVSVWSGSKWDTYFKNLSNQWLKSNGNGGDQSGIVIRSGTSIRIVKKGTATGSASFLGQALPYNF